MNLTKAQLQLQKLQTKRQYRAVIEHVADQIYRRVAVKTEKPQPKGKDT